MLALYKTSYFFLIFLLIFASCKSQLAIKGNNKYKELAFSKFGKDTVSIYNADKTLVLCVKSSKSDLNQANSLQEFFIFSLDEKKIVYEDCIARANISWHSNIELLISIQKGIIISPTDQGKSKYIYNLKTKEKSLYNSQPDNYKQ
jgi:hypothetical protein